MQRFENMVRLRGPGAATTARARAFWIRGYVEVDLNAFKEDSSTSNCSSQVCRSEQKKCQQCEPYQSEEQGVCDKDHGCGIETRTRDRRDVIGEGEMRIKNETEVSSFNLLRIYTLQQ